MAVLIREDLGGEGIALGIGEDLASSLDKYLQRKIGPSFHLDSCWYCTCRFQLFFWSIFQKKKNNKKKKKKNLPFGFSLQVGPCTENARTFSPKHHRISVQSPYQYGTRPSNTALGNSKTSR